MGKVYDMCPNASKLVIRIELLSDKRYLVSITKPDSYESKVIDEDVIGAVENAFKKILEDY